MQEAAAASAQTKSKTWLSIYLDLSKARLSFLVVITTFIGYLMAMNGAAWIEGLTHTIMGTALAAAGANAFNQWIERARDKRMRRTSSRPLPNGDISSSHALLFAILTSTLGVVWLFIWVNALTAGLALANILVYVLVYTPLKTRSSLCTLVGAVCGAIPPLMGWSAATGSIGYGAWILAAILFIWQIPHFLALAWMYRDDYARGGFQMLPLIDPEGHLTCRVILLYCLALVALGCAGTLSNTTGGFYLAASTAAGVVFLRQALRLNRQRTYENARALFLGSLIYLPLVLGFLVVDKNLNGISNPPAQPNVVERQTNKQPQLAAWRTQSRTAALNQVHSKP